MTTELNRQPDQQAESVDEIPQSKSSGEVKLFVGILIAALVLVAVAVLPTLLNKIRAPHVEEVTTVPEKITAALLIPQWSHIRGDISAPFTLVEFGDYQCPTCENAHNMVTEILKRFKDRIRLVYHHSQINLGHHNAGTLAMAAAAADEQGKFWEMHDLLYKNQKSFETEDKGAVLDELTRLAGDLKLDVLKFRSSLTGAAARKAVAKQSDIGEKANIGGTPTFFFVPPSGKIKEVPFALLEKFLAKDANWK